MSTLFIQGLNEYSNLPNTLKECTSIITFKGILGVYLK